MHQTFPSLPGDNIKRAQTFAARFPFFIFESGLHICYAHKSFEKTETFPSTSRRKLRNEDNIARFTIIRIIKHKTNTFTTLDITMRLQKYLDVLTYGLASVILMRCKTEV